VAPLVLPRDYRGLRRGASGGTVKQVSKNFFFEKKKQKTFISFGPVAVKTARSKTNKVFFASFLFTKKKTLPLVAD
jgi:hypothetical protein